jgi:hypothetical protein
LSPGVLSWVLDSMKTALIQSLSIHVPGQGGSGFTSRQRNGIWRTIEGVDGT